MIIPKIRETLELIDITGDISACERWLKIRNKSDDTLTEKTRTDLLDDLKRHSGELLHIASHDGLFAATTYTVKDDTNTGACYLTLFAGDDPSEPNLGDLVDFAIDRVRALGVRDIRCSGRHDRPYITALIQRHGFHIYEHWRHFHINTFEAPKNAQLDANNLPENIHVTTLADSPELLDQAFEVYEHGMIDTFGDFPIPDETPNSWLNDLDSSPILDRKQVMLLVDSSNVILALVDLHRMAAESDRAWLEFLIVARNYRGRGLARITKRCAVNHARTLGFRELKVMNHADNKAICRLNEQLEWVEDASSVALNKTVA